MTSKTAVRFLDRTTPPHILTLTLLAGISALNLSIFLPSLAGMTEYFGTTYATMQIAVSGYFLATAILQILIGPISDRYGRRMVVLWSLTIFVVATVGAMLSTSAEMFLFFRMMQCVVATGVALSRAIVRDMFETNKAASMIGYVTMGMALVPMFGPMIGGAIDQLFDWRAVFGFLVFAGLVVLALCYFDQGETVRDGGMGFAEQIKTYPELLKSPRFWGYALAASFGSGAFFALLGGASYVSTTVFGLSPFWAGVALGAPAIGYAVGNGLSGRYSERFGINLMALVGSLITLGGMVISLIFLLVMEPSPYIFFGLVTLLGLGNGLLIPNTAVGLMSVRPHLAGTASGLGSAMMIAGGAAAAQMAATLLDGGDSPLPLQWVMVATSALAVASMIYVIRRTRKVKG
ncbi:multidrug effflux MFS transporter [Cognatiyoonia sp.]|uniref:multidrug effflux MFS transporter n=1 Tax=Cognatiyoonia sp. TaxID=2211652 RepID=UPI003F6A3AA6